MSATICSAPCNDVDECFTLSAAPFVLRSPFCRPTNISNVLWILVIGMRLNNVGSCLIGAIAMTNIVAVISH